MSAALPVGCETRQPGVPQRAGHHVGHRVVGESVLVHHAHLHRLLRLLPERMRFRATEEEVAAAVAFVVVDVVILLNSVIKKMQTQTVVV